MSKKKSLDRIDILNKMSGYSKDLFNDVIFDKLVKNHNKEFNVFLNVLLYLEKKQSITISKEDVEEPKFKDNSVMFIIQDIGNETMLTTFKKCCDNIKTHGCTILSNINNNDIYINITKG